MGNSTRRQCNMTATLVQASERHSGPAGHSRCGHSRERVVPGRLWGRALRPEGAFHRVGPSRTAWPCVLAENPY
jgi:hypothetical protein